MSTNLIALPEGPPVPLPPARNKGAEELYAPGRMDRLYHWLPPEAKPLAAQFITAIAAEVNGLPRDTDPRSIVRATFNLATLGLIPGQQRGHAHFLTFLLNRGKPNEIRTCQLVIGYRGVVDLAWGTGFLSELLCEVVLDGEEFRRWNDSAGAQLHHDLPLGRELSWGKVKASYCYYKPKTTDPAKGKGNVVIVESKELAKLKRRGNVWDSEPVPMAKKTAVLRASKLWKVTGKMANAVWLSEAEDRGETQGVLPEAAEAIGEIEGADPTPKLTDFQPPTDDATEPETDDGGLSTALFSKYDAQLRGATLKAALDMALNDIQADPNLLQAHREALEATYRECQKDMGTE